MNLRWRMLYGLPISLSETISGLDSVCVQRLTKRTKFVRDIIREVAGLAPYERRCQELLKVGKDKRALKLCKRKVQESSVWCDNSLFLNGPVYIWPTAL